MIVPLFEGSPLFLSLDEVLEIHQIQVAAFGGDPGIRDIGLLESALAQPRQGFGGEFLHSDMASMAAAYLFHITLNHPFIDGNKRTGLHAALTFLTMNDHHVQPPPEEVFALCTRVASGEERKEEVAEFFRRLLANQ